MISTDSRERKDIPVYSGFVKYFPLAMAEVARLSQASNQKHNGDAPLHWTRDISNDHADCLMRHMLQAGEMDTDGFSHTVKVAWRAMALLQVELEQNALDLVQSDGKYGDHDNRVSEPFSGIRNLFAGADGNGSPDPVGTVGAVQGVEPSSDNPDRLGVFQRHEQRLEAMLRPVADGRASGLAAPCPDVLDAGLRDGDEGAEVGVGK